MEVMWDVLIANEMQFSGALDDGKDKHGMPRNVKNTGVSSLRGSSTKNKANVWRRPWVLKRRSKTFSLAE